MKKKILFVLTSHGVKGSTGQPTGYYLSEVSHAWHVLKNAGFDIDFVSPLGGEPPVDGFDLSDPVNKAFVDDAVAQGAVKSTRQPDQVNPADYDAIYFAGGHGTMWDLPDNKALASLTARIYEQGGTVAAVCHGPAGLVNVKLDNGSYLVSGKRVAAFSDDEERAVKLEKVVPFLLETTLRDRGAQYSKAGLWQAHVVSDQRLVTGQNPASAKGVAEAVLVTLGVAVPQD